MKICEYCNLQKKNEDLLPRNAIRSDKSIKRYLDKIYNKSSGLITKEGTKNYALAFQAWVYKEHSKVLCLECCNVSKSKRDEIIDWAKNPTEVFAPYVPIKKAKIEMRKPKKEKSPKKVVKKDNAVRSSFEVGVVKILKDIKSIKKIWHSDNITEKERAKASKVINTAIQELTRKEPDLDFKL